MRDRVSVFEQIQAPQRDTLYRTMFLNWLSASTSAKRIARGVRKCNFGGSLDLDISN
jgi:hypothetical protein